MNPDMMGSQASQPGGDTCAGNQPTFRISQFKAPYKPVQGTAQRLVQPVVTDQRVTFADVTGGTMKY